MNQNYTTAKPSGDSPVLFEIFRLVRQLADRGGVALDDALDDAATAVRERRNQLADPGTSTLLQLNVDPEIRRVAAITGIDIGIVKDVGYAVLLPSRALLVADTLRNHLAHVPATLKTVVPARPTTAIGRANAHAVEHRLKVGRRRA